MPMKKTTNRKAQLLGTALVMLAAICWSTIGVYVRQLTEAGLRTWDIALIRMTIGLAAMAVYLVPFHPERLRVRLKDLWIFAGAGILSLLCMNYCYNETVKAASLAVAGTLLYTAPTFVMLMSLWFFREKMTVRKGIALVLAFVGCALVSGIVQGQLVLTPRAFLIGLGSGFSYALYSIFSRAALDRGYDSWTITFYSFVFCVLGALLPARPAVIVQSAAAAPALLVPMVLLGIVTGFLAYLLYTKGLTALEPGRASIIASLELVAGAVVGVIVYREHLGADVCAGIAVLLFAVALLSVEKKK